MFRYQNRKFVIIISLLVLVGILAIFSASQVWAQMKYGDSLYYVRRQLLFVVAGFLIMGVVSYLDIKKLVSLVLYSMSYASLPWY